MEKVSEVNEIGVFSRESFALVGSLSVLEGSFSVLFAPAPHAMEVEMKSAARNFVS